MSARLLTAPEAKKIIHEQFMLRLADAPFDRADAKLLPKAGACTMCPKRTGNQAELFSDVKSADVCTDTLCFAAKKKAHGDRLIADAKASGKPVIDGKKAAAMFYPKRGNDESGDELKYGVGVVKLDEKQWIGSKNVTLRSLAKGVETKLLQSPTGTVLEVLDKATAYKLVAKASPRGRATNEYSDQQRKQAKAAKLRRAVQLHQLGAVVAKASSSIGAEESFWRMFAGIAVENVSHDCAKAVIQRRGIKIERKPGGYGYETKALTKLLATTKGAGELRALALEVLIAERLGFHTEATTLKLAAEHFKVDLEKCAKEAKAALKTKKGKK